MTRPATTRKVALVTGAGSGIGRAVTLALARHDYAVVLAGRRLPALEALAREGGASCLPIATDVTQEASVSALFTRVEQVFGRLDLLFNNAGTSSPSVPGRTSTPASSITRARNGAQTRPIGNGVVRSVGMVAGIRCAVQTLVSVGP